MNFYKLIIIFSHMLSVLTCEFFARLASLVRSIIYGSKPPVQELAKILEQAARNMDTQKEAGFTAYSLPPTYGNITQGEVKKIIETFEKPAGATPVGPIEVQDGFKFVTLDVVAEPSAQLKQMNESLERRVSKRQLKEKEPNPITQKFGRKIIE
jgi:hypothetical protein